MIYMPFPALIALLLFAAVVFQVVAILSGHQFADSKGHPGWFFLTVVLSAGAMGFVSAATAVGLVVVR